MLELVDTAKLATTAFQNMGAVIAATATTAAETIEPQLFLPQLIEAHVLPTQNTVPLEFVFEPAITPEQRKNAIAQITGIFEGGVLEDFDEQHTVLP